MTRDDPAEVARRLLSEQGPPEAWQHSTREAIDAHLRRDASASAHWAAVQRELRATAPRPGPGDLDVYSSARHLIFEHGRRGAASYAMGQAEEARGDPVQEAIWLRIADAVAALGRGSATDA